jgi:hypothetical protein
MSLFNHFGQRKPEEVIFSSSTDAIDSVKEKLD